MLTYFLSFTTASVQVENFNKRKAVISFTFLSCCVIKCCFRICLVFWFFYLFIHNRNDSKTLIKKNIFIYFPRDYYTKKWYM